MLKTKLWLSVLSLPAPTPPPSSSLSSTGGREYNKGQSCSKHIVDLARGAHICSLTKRHLFRHPVGKQAVCSLREIHGRSVEYGGDRPPPMGRLPSSRVNGHWQPSVICLKHELLFFWMWFPQTYVFQRTCLYTWVCKGWCIQQGRALSRHDQDRRVGNGNSHPLSLEYTLVCQRQWHITYLWFHTWFSLDSRDSKLINTLLEIQSLNHRMWNDLPKVTEKLRFEPAALRCRLFFKQTTLLIWDYTYSSSPNWP